MQTKTYFTTSTFFTTYIDKERTITKTRTSVRSNIITETYSGGQFDYLPQPGAEKSPTIEESPQEKYLSLGPNIYGLVKTLYTTYTYFNGIGKDSREVITQESTSVFSTTSLPASITIAPSPPLPSITPSASLQLDRDTLLSLKQQYISQISSSVSDTVEPSFTATYAPDDTGATISSSSATPVIPDTTHLSSIKESYQSQISGTTTSSSQSVVTDVNVPSSANTVIRPSSTSSTAASSSSLLSTSSPTNEDSSEESNTAVQDAVAGGLLGAVVGGISSALITPPQPPPSGIQVDLGPVLDAVATLLRGPIRSAIANRRNTAQNTDRTDIEPSRTATVPQFARIPSSEPNVIPVGGYTSAVPSGNRDPVNGFIPLNAPQQALPRSDTELESELSYNDIGQIPEDILNILEQSNNGGEGNPITIDNDKIVINDHIIRTNDPHIIDVLNKYEHSYLYNQETNDPLKIRIAAGEPMQQPPPPKQQQPTKIFGITLPKINLGGSPSPSPPSKPSYKPVNKPSYKPQPPRRPNPPPPQRRPPPPPSNAKRPYINNGNKRPLPPPPPPAIKNVPVKYKPQQKPAQRPSYNKPQPPPRPQYDNKPQAPPVRPSYDTNTVNIRPSVTYNNGAPSNVRPGGSYVPTTSVNNIPPKSPVTNQIVNSQPYPSVWPQSTFQNQNSNGKPYSSGGSIISNGNSYPSNSINKIPPPPKSTVSNQISNSYPTQPTYGNQNSFTPNVNPFNVATSNSNKYPKPGPPQTSVIDTSVNQIPGSNQWNTYGPGQPVSAVSNGFKDNGNLGQGQSTPVSINQQPSSHSGSHSQHGLSSPVNNDVTNHQDSVSSVSEQSKIVMVAPPGMKKDDNEGQSALSSDTTAFDPTKSHTQHNSANTFQLVSSGNNAGPGSPSVNVNGQINNAFGAKFPNAPPSISTPALRPVAAVPRPNPPRGNPTLPPFISTLPPFRTTPIPQRTTRRTVSNNSIRRTTSRPLPTRRTTSRPLPTRRTSVAPPPTRGNLNGGISRRPPINGTPSPFRPNQVAIDVPTFSPNENAVRDPFGQVLSQQQGPGSVHRNQHNNGARNPNKSRQTTSELSATLIQGSNQIIGNGGGIVIGSPTKGFMRDVTITGTDGGVAVIQTRYDGAGAPEIDPSFTVSAGYNPVSNTEVYTIDTTKDTPLFTLIQPSSSKKNYEYEGWLTDGDPLKDLPPLRPATTQPLDIKVVETEAPKTVTYHNEWHTPTETPTADFVPFSPPPPASNFDREWSTYRSGQVETVGVIRPTDTLGYQVKETEAPKTVTYQNEWFANSATKTVGQDNPSKVVPDFVRQKPYTTSSPVRTPRPTRPKYRPKVTRPKISRPVGTVEEASVNDEDVDAGITTRRPFRNRPTRLPSLRTTRLPRPRPTRPPIRRITAAPEIITGGVRVPPRPPRPQTYDPFAEYQDRYPDAVNDDDYSEVFDNNQHHTNHGIRKKPVNLPVLGRPANDGANNYELLLQNAVKNGISDNNSNADDSDSGSNIRVSSDGYNGYKQVNALDKDQNSDNDQLIRDEGSGLNEYPPFVTTARPRPGAARPSNNNIIDTENAELQTDNKTYHSSEYVNEKRWKLRRKPVRGGNNDNDDDLANTDNNNLLTPTRRPSLSTSDDKSDGRESSVAGGEIDLHNFLDKLHQGEDKTHNKRKFETSTSKSTRNTFSTGGKPTFINNDLSTALANDNAETDGKKEVIVTTPIRIIDDKTTSRIRPISTLSRPVSTLSGTVTAVTSPIVSSVRLGGYPFPKRPRPDISYKAEDEIKDDEVLNKNVEAAIVEQVPEYILSAEDQDPQTKCQLECGENETCHITDGGVSACKCRPGFGKPTNLPGSKCESKL